ncbi:unnamed protein product, partial [Ectocarpus fasciculatus]
LRCPCPVVAERTQQQAVTAVTAVVHTADHGSMTEKGKEDGSVTETLEEKVQEMVTDAREETGGSSADGVIDTLKGGLQTVKGAYSTVTGGVAKAWQTLGEWKDQGTPLRKVFKTARLDLEDAAAKARERAACRQTEMSKSMQKMAEERKARFKEFDESGACSLVMNRRRSLTVCHRSLPLILLLLLIIIIIIIIIIIAFCLLSASLGIGG